MSIRFNDKAYRGPVASSSSVTNHGTPRGTGDAGGANSMAPPAAALMRQMLRALREDLAEVPVAGLHPSEVVGGIITMLVEVERAPAAWPHERQHERAVAATATRPTLEPDEDDKELEPEIVRDARRWARQKRQFAASGWS
jgi:hypothetical protein